MTLESDLATLSATGLCFHGPDGTGYDFTAAGIAAAARDISKDSRLPPRAHESYEPTLRDRFAIAALTGLLGANDSRESTVAPWREQSATVVAAAAYEYADAMLAARASKPAATETP